MEYFNISNCQGVSERCECYWGHRFLIKKDHVGRESCQSDLQTSSTLPLFSFTLTILLSQTEITFVDNECVCSDKNSLCYDLIVSGGKVASLIFKLVKVILSQGKDQYYLRVINIELTLLLPGFLTNDYCRGGVFRTPKHFSANFDLFLDLWNSS